MSPGRFLLADDNTLLRSSLAKLIGLWRNDVTIEEAADGQDAIKKARSLRPDVILMDVKMPNCDGIQATRAIKSETPQTKVIMLTVSEDDDDLFEAIRAGAHGYLLKNMRPEELFQRLDEALNGESVIAPIMARRVLEAFITEVHRHAGREQSGMELSPRELEVLELASQGATNKEIAGRLFISLGTAKNHVHNILEKLHLKNRVQLATYSHQRGVHFAGKR